MEEVRRKVRVAAIRDHVLPLLRARGQEHRYGCPGGLGPLHLTAWEIGPFRFVLREPHRPVAWTEWSATPAARTTPRPGGDPALRLFGLDVEQGERVVLSLAWDPGGAVEVVAFRPGTWEDKVLTLR
jgi:hypothetical protein